jgi:hypothetical protein
VTYHSVKAFVVPLQALAFLAASPEIEAHRSQIPTSTRSALRYSNQQCRPSQYGPDTTRDVVGLDTAYITATNALDRAFGRYSRLASSQAARRRLPRRP